MDITEVRIKLMDDSHERLQAFCSITIDACFVVRDLKIINGTKGPFVAMPSRKLTDRCPKCSAKNCLRAVHCSQCGVKLPEERAARGEDGRAKLYADIAHPINSACRELIQQRVLDAFEQEQVLAQQPDYVCRYDDFGEDEDFDSKDDWSEEPVSTRSDAEETRRRIEPAASIPAGPHQRSTSQVPQQAAQLERVVRSADDEADDDFGSGII
ncbi:MAG: stage V sporulation protein G [Planctomycetota bacterium]|nr:MAG: stage V sporulation protein G [Planctomycetota bacterium]REJ91554.1 MAG: stage V sporulation protein G [Planctomycetota bacterium]REK20513.1 MAG: stage V sporulation protein G [Planctomycetota bacterium]REK28267.1 MAG: stage V sporulation protein G [Planctomycetota bacterium]